MITAQLSLIKDGEAMNMCAVSFIINCPFNAGQLEFKLNTEHKGVWSTISKSVTLRRKGYNFIFFYIQVAPATYAELEVTEMTGIDVIYASTIAAVSMVRV